MDTDKIAKMVIAIANSPANLHYTRDSIKELAQTRLRLELIAKKNSVSAYQIGQIHKNENEKHFLKIIDRVVLLHRKAHGNKVLPYPLPGNARFQAAKMLENKYAKDVENQLSKLRDQHQKTEKRVIDAQGRLHL